MGATGSVNVQLTSTTYKKFHLNLLEELCTTLKIWHSEAQLELQN